MKSGNLKRFFKKLKPKSKFEKELARLSRESEERDARSLSELLSTNPFIKNVKQIDYTQFYDSTWFVETADGDVEITRDDMETIEAMCKALKNIKTIEDIKALDERDKIYYD